MTIEPSQSPLAPGSSAIRTLNARMGRALDDCGNHLLCELKPWSNYGPVIVSERAKTLLGATGVAVCQSVTTGLVAITAFSGRFGKRRAAGGMRGNCRE